MRQARDRHEQTLAIANVPGSAMLREAGAAMVLAAGPEKAIPATKSFTCQLTALYLLAIYLGRETGAMDAAEAGRQLRELEAIPGRLVR